MVIYDDYCASKMLQGFSRFSQLMKSVSVHSEYEVICSEILRLSDLHADMIKNSLCDFAYSFRGHQVNLNLLVEFSEEEIKSVPGTQCIWISILMHEDCGIS